MSTPRSDQRKSASFKQESFEQEWQKLAESAKVADAKRKPAVPKLELRDVNGSDSPKKTQDQSAWKSSQSDRSADAVTTQPQTHTITTTQTTTTTQTDPMAHTKPVITPRKQTRFAPETSSDGGPSQEKTSARSEKAVDSPRRQKILSREPVQSKRSGSPSVSTTTTPSSSPAVTPREKDQFESPRGLKANQFRKRISTQFSKVALDLSKINEKLTSGRNSPPSSPGSAGRVSPSKITPRKKENAFIKSLRYEVRNSAAKCFIKLQKEGNFRPPFSARERLVLNAGMIGVLSDHGIKYDLKNVEALAIDAENRSKNYSIDIKIDLSEEPHKSNFMEGAGKFGNMWKKEVGMPISEYSEAPENERQFACENFLSMFIKDYFRRGVSHELQLPDGNSRPFNSLEEMAKFLNGDNKNSHRSQYVSNVTSQNFAIFVQQLACGGLPGTTSPVKLYDGTPLIPRGRTEQKYVYSMDDQGVISIKTKISVFSNNGTNAVRASQIQDDMHTAIIIDDNAWLTIESELVFETDDEWSISDLRLRGEGWSLPTEKL